MGARWAEQPTEELLEPLNAEHALSLVSWHFRRDHFVENSLEPDSIAGGHMLLLLETHARKVHKTRT